MASFEDKLSQISTYKKPEEAKVEEVKKEEEVVEKSAPKEEAKVAQPEGLDEEKIFGALDGNEELFTKYLSKKAGKEIKSLDDLKEVVEKEVVKEAELPEDVQKFYEYKKNTGRGFEDFLKSQKDWKAESKQAVVMEHIRQTEGFDGDSLKDYFNLSFIPEEDASERDVKLAELRLEKAYNQAMRYLEDQQKQYSLPSELKSSQRQAEEQAQKEAENFKLGMTEALNGFKSIAIDDFSFDVGEDAKNLQGLTTLEGLLKQYQGEQGFNYKQFLADVYAGQNRDKLAKAYAEHAKNKTVESEFAKMSNKTTQTQPVGAQAPDGKQAAQIFKKYF